MQVHAKMGAIVAILLGAVAIILNFNIVHVSAQTRNETTEIATSETFDAGIVRGIAFLDHDNDGLLSSDDTPLENVTFELVYLGENTDVFWLNERVDTQQSDSTGQYRFVNVEEGYYFVRAAVDNSSIETWVDVGIVDRNTYAAFSQFPDSGNDDTIDSDILPLGPAEPPVAIGQSYPFVVAPTSADMVIDAGLVSYSYEPTSVTAQLTEAGVESTLTRDIVIWLSLVALTTAAIVHKRNAASHPISVRQ